MENRLELKILNAQIKVAQAQLYSAIGNIVPDPTLAGGPSVSNNAPAGPKLNAYFFTWNVETPVFNWQQGDIARLRATIKQYYAQVGAQRNLITNEVSQAYNDLIISRERIRTYQEHVLEDSAAVARMANRSYEVGQYDITSTLLAQQANVQVRSQYLEAVLTYQLALTNLEQSVGEPLEW
jgi:outer membrane protein TolC